MFTVVPFGLKIMTGHMQRVMEKLLGRLGKLHFQEDIAIETNYGSNHVKDVLELLECLTYEDGLQLRLKKCKFFKKEDKVYLHQKELKLIHLRL